MFLAMSHTRPETTSGAHNLNDVRSANTQAKLISATVRCLIDLGYSRTSGVEICRRAQVTRGALNHHYTSLAELYVATLAHVYGQLRARMIDQGEDEAEDAGALESWTRKAYQVAIRPEFKVVLELWLASRNDPEFGEAIATAIRDESGAFAPAEILAPGAGPAHRNVATTYRVIQETLIGLGVGRIVNGSDAVEHEADVLSVLVSLARAADTRG